MFSVPIRPSIVDAVAVVVAAVVAVVVVAVIVAVVAVAVVAVPIQPSIPVLVGFDCWPSCLRL